MAEPQDQKSGAAPGAAAHPPGGRGKKNKGRKARGEERKPRVPEAGAAAPVPAPAAAAEPGTPVAVVPPGPAPAGAAKASEPAPAVPPAPAGAGPETAAAPAAASPGAVVPPKHHAKPALGTEAKADMFLQTATTSIDKLRENWQVVAAALLVLVVVTVFIALRIEAGRTRNREAWEALRSVEKLELATAEDFRRALENYRGTTAEPFFILRAADAEFKRGGREGVEAAARGYQEVLDRFPENPLAAHLAKQGLDAAKGVLAFDAVTFASGKGDRVEMVKDVLPLPTPGGAAPPSPEPGGTGRPAGASAPSPASPPPPASVPAPSSAPAPVPAAAPPPAPAPAPPEAPR